MSFWTPLECNPEVMTKYIHSLGVSKKWCLTDVLGLDPEVLEWVPKPVKAVILLFPCSETYEKHRVEQNAALEKDPPKYPDDLFYMKQVIHNACGAIALVHCIANCKDIEIEDGIFKKYLDSAWPLSPEERGKLLESDDGLTNVHQEVAPEGQTAVEEQPNHHFIALVNKNNELYELDGRKFCPIKHGSTSDETFLQDAAKVCKEFMERDPDEVRFSVMAIVPNQE